jgi:hypothetical protein
LDVREERTMQRERKQKTVRALVYYPDRRGGQVEEIEDSLKGYQALVGGSIEGWSMGSGITMYCNGNGIAEGLPHNPNSDRLPHPVPGVFFFTSTDAEANEAELTEADIAALRARPEPEPVPREGGGRGAVRGGDRTP